MASKNDRDLMLKLEFSFAAHITKGLVLSFGAFLESE